jgi:murein tripeptide amidase MpaA
VIEYLAYQLIDGYKSGDGNVTAFLDHYDFYLVPFHNPDGKPTTLSQPSQTTTP